MTQSRLASFVAKLTEREVDAIPVSGADNRRCPSGLLGSASICLPRWGGVCIEDILILREDGATPFIKAFK